MWKIWLIISFLFFIIEILRHDCFFLWYAIGAGITVFVTFLTQNLFLTLIMFLSISSLLSLLFSKRIPSKSKKLKSLPFTSENLIGSHGKVIKTIGPTTLQSGLVKLDNEIWSAISPSNTIISKGSSVEIISIQGVYVSVIPLAK